MEGFCLNLDNPIRDAISRVRFAPRSNNLLVTSWDSVLRLFDAEQSVLRLEAPSEAGLLNCCFQDEHVAFCVDTDCCVRRYDLISGSQIALGNQGYLATCIEYSDSTNLLITAGLDKTVTIWDPNTASIGQRYSVAVSREVESMSLCGIHLLVASGTTIGMFDLRNLGGPVQMLTTSLEYPITCITSFPNSQGYAAGSVDGRVAINCLYPSPSDEAGYIFHCWSKAKSRRYELAAINDIEFHPRYGLFITGDDQGHAIVWDGHSRKRLYEAIYGLLLWGKVFFDGPILVAMVKLSFQSIRFSKFWRADSPQPTIDYVVSLSYCHDGELLAVASSVPYQRGNKIDEAPQVFAYKVEEILSGQIEVIPDRYSVY